MRLDRAIEIDIPKARKGNYTASFYNTFCPNGDTWKDKSQLQKYGKA
jgi:hypothetical protein